MAQMEQTDQIHAPPPPQPEDNSLLNMLTTGQMRIVSALVALGVSFGVIYWSFLFMRDQESSKWLIAVIALVVGVFGVWMVYASTNFAVEQLPPRTRDMLRPYVFVGPAMLILTVYLVWPTLDTIRRSFLNNDSSGWVGFRHYERIFTTNEFRQILGNNLFWIIFVTGGAVGAGLLIAVMVDRIGRWEPVAKALIFLPMAISAVGASVIWKFMYDIQTEPDRPEIGFLNAGLRGLFGQDATIDFVRESPLNNFAFMFIMFWMITGFCMVILSAAVKGVPSELLEAGRIDGANEVQIFLRIIVPTIGPTILTVSTTVLIMVLKVFDIVYVFGGQLYNADVIANRMFRELFTNVNYGIGSALATVLLVAVMPLIFWNLYQLRQQGR